MTSLKNQNLDKINLVEKFRSMITNLDNPASISEFNDPANLTKLKIAILISNLKDSKLNNVLQQIINIAESNNSIHIFLLKELIRVSKLNAKDKIAELKEELMRHESSDSIISEALRQSIRGHELSENIRIWKETGVIQTLYCGAYFLEKAKEEFSDGGGPGLADFIKENSSIFNGLKTDPIGDKIVYFIADVLEGKIKRRKGRVSNKKLDLQIAWAVDLQLELGRPLRSNRTKTGAIDFVAEEFGIDKEETVLKAYQRMKSVIDDWYEEREWNPPD